MKLSISVAASPSSMAHIMFSGALDRTLALLASLGYDGVDLFFPSPRGVDAAEVRKLLDLNGLQATMLASQGDLMADGLYLNEPSRLRELLERSKYHLEQCALLGAMPNVGFFRGAHKGRAESIRNMAEGLAAYCELAASMGVGVLLEPICRYEIDSIPTAGDALALWGMAGRPDNLFLLLDLFHMNIEERSMSGAILASRGRIGHVHFVENTRSMPGLGCQNFGEILGCLRNAGYDGFLGFEAISRGLPEQEAENAVAYVRALLNGFNITAL